MRCAWLLLLASSLFAEVTQEDVSVQRPSLEVRFETEGSLEPELNVDVLFGVGNYGPAAAADTTVELELPGESAVVSVTPLNGADCTTAATTVRCSAGTLQPNGGAEIRVKVRAPAAYRGGSFPLTVRADSSTPTDNDWRKTQTVSWTFVPLFVVSTVVDSGPGSLRQAIVDANAGCGSDCRIGFRIPATSFENGAAIIRVASPLPRVTGPITIDGASERTFVEQPDIRRPLVMIDGRALLEGNGFEIAGRLSAIRSLAIGGFPGAGITLLPAAGNTLGVGGCYIGTDANGTAAVPNGRGIIAPGFAGISENLISGNLRTGIWLAGGDQSFIRTNRIGVSADGTPLPNGGSGIYVAQGCSRPSIDGNTIANNGEFGIAIHPSVRRVRAWRNSIYSNGRYGIDYGLDLATPNVENDTGRAPNVPVLLSARYDDVRRRTLVTGQLFSFPDQSNRFTVVFYANSEAINAQAEKEAGSWIVSGNGTFEAELTEDYRGKSLTAVTVRALRFEPDEGFSVTEDTSEISAPIPVQ